MQRATYIGPFKRGVSPCIVCIVSIQGPIWTNIGYPRYPRGIPSILAQGKKDEKRHQFPLTNMEVDGP